MSDFENEWDRWYFAALIAVCAITLPLLMTREYFPTSWSNGITSTVALAFLVGIALMVVRYAALLAHLLFWLAQKLMRRS
jgi:hypothetical protein